MKFIICLLLSFLGLYARGQFRFAKDESIPVHVNGTKLSRPWEGGINSAQYQKLDLNHDGTEDLVIYHRMSGMLSTYLAVENKYVFSPEYAAFFPEEVSDWLILADYNCDGLKDIFTSTPLGIKVFENKSSTPSSSIKEMIEEVGKLFGNNSKKGWIEKHVERDAWLKSNPDLLGAKYKLDLSGFTVRSFFITQEDMLTPYLTTRQSALPFVTLYTLKEKGLDALK